MRFRGGRFSRPACIVWVCAVVFALPANAGDPADPRAETRRMAERLEQIAASADPMKNPNLNHQRAEHYRQELAQGKDAGAATLARYNYAHESLLAGASEVAVRELQLIQQKIDQGGGAAAFPKLAPAIRRELGMAWLRLGEQENCIIRHGPESCVLPIRGAGVHTLPRGSRAAIEVFTAALQADPQDYESLWLLNIGYMTLGEHPGKVPPQWLIPPSAFASEYDVKLFSNIAPQLGLDTFGGAGGAIMEDFDRDGDLDIMSSSMGLRDPIRYFVNNADGTFSERTAEAGLTGIVSGLNLTDADYNNDGYIDVLVIRGAWLDDAGLHPESLLRNMGNTSCTATTARGLRAGGGSPMSAPPPA